jgi:hypothetical protein
MATGFGRLGYMAFGVESTYGTLVAATKYLELLDESLALSYQSANIPILRQYGQAFRSEGNKSVGGSIRTPLLVTGCEKLIQHALGTLGTTGAGPYTHTFTPAAELPTGLSVYVSRDAAAIGASKTFCYDGMNIKRLALISELEQPVALEVEFVGRAENLVANLTPTFPAYAPYDGSAGGASFQWNSVGHSVRRFELSIENVLSENRYNLGSTNRSALGRGGVTKITGSATLEFSNTTEVVRTDFTVKTPRALSMVWTIGANTTTVTLPNAICQAATPPLSDHDVILMDVEFEAFQSTPGTAEISIVQVNSTAAP